MFASVYAENVDSSMSLILSWSTVSLFPEIIWLESIERNAPAG